MRHEKVPDLEKRNGRRLALNRWAHSLFFLATLFGLIVLIILFYRVLKDGLGWLNLSFLTNRLSTDPEQAGIMGALLGTLWLMVVVAPVTTLLGLGTAIYLEEYATKSRLQRVIQTNMANLAGVPSIVFGLLGLTLFVRAADLGQVVLAGGLTMSLLVLPIVVVAAQEALRAVPNELREAAYAMGANKWQAVSTVVLPAAMPSILTGVILALSRAVGETAPLIVLGIPVLLIPFPNGLFDKFTVLPVQIYYWTLDSALVSEYIHLAAATIIILLLFLITMNSAAIWIRNRYQSRT